MRPYKLLSIKTWKENARNHSTAGENDNDMCRRGQSESVGLQRFRPCLPAFRQLGTSVKSFGHHWYRSSPSSLSGASCASISCVAPSWDQRPEGDVVGRLVPGAMSQYAVISVRTEPRCERVVIAYLDEKSLRNLLAASSMLRVVRKNSSVTRKTQKSLSLSWSCPIQWNRL